MAAGVGWCRQRTTASSFAASVVSVCIERLDGFCCEASLTPSLRVTGLVHWAHLWLSSCHVTMAGAWLLHHLLSWLPAARLQSPSVVTTAAERLGRGFGLFGSDPAAALAVRSAGQRADELVSEQWPRSRQAAWRLALGRAGGRRRAWPFAGLRWSSGGWLSPRRLRVRVLQCTGTGPPLHGAKGRGAGLLAGRSPSPHCCFHGNDDLYEAFALRRSSTLERSPLRCVVGRGAGLVAGHAPAPSSTTLDDEL